MRIRKMVESRRIREIVDFIETNIHIRRFWTNTYIRSTNTYIRPVPILGVTYTHARYTGTGNEYHSLLRYGMTGLQ